MDKCLRCGVTKVVNKNYCDKCVEAKGLAVTVLANHFNLMVSCDGTARVSKLRAKRV